MTSRLDACYSVVRGVILPDGWAIKSISELVRVVSGGTPDRKDGANWREGTIPWITPTDLTANDDKYVYSGAENITQVGQCKSSTRILPVGSIIFSSRGTVGTLAIAAAPMTINQSCEALIAKDGEVDSEFLFYALSHGMFAFHRLAGGTTFGSITGKEIGRVRLAVPSFGEQLVIARVISEVDQIISETKRAVSGASQLTVAILSDFFSIRSKKCPNVGLGDHISSGPTNGLYRPESDYGQQGTPIVRIDSFSNGAIGNVSLLRRLSLSIAMQSRFALTAGDILINRVNALTHVGKAAIVPELTEPTVFESNMMRLQCGPNLRADYLILVLRSEIARRHWLSRAKAAVNQVSINQRDVKALRFPLPSLYEQDALVTAVAAADSVHRLHQERLGQLKMLKQSLMHDLLTGTVRIPPSLFTA